MFKPHTINRGNLLLSSCVGFVFVVLVVLIIYLPTLSYDFTNWDDPSFVQDNQAIQTPGWSGLKRVFTRTIPDGFGDYMPVTILSYWVNYQLWRFHPKGYHLTNLLLHALSAGLIFLLLQRLTLRPVASLMVTFLFALHPMNTEAVTWIAGRKSVMAMLWMLVSFHAFLNWQRISAVKRKYLYLSLLCYVLACLSKTAVVFFPLLLMAYQICLRKVDIKQSMVTIISFFLISFLVGLCRFFGHYTSGQMTLKPFETPWMHLLTVFEIFGFYLKKLIIPVSLNNNYPLEIANSIFEAGVLFGIYYPLINAK